MHVCMNEKVNEWLLAFFCLFISCIEEANTDKADHGLMTSWKFSSP